VTEPCHHLKFAKIKLSEAVSPYSVEARIADGAGVDGNSYASDTEFADTYHQAQRDYDAAGDGARAQAFITMLVAERVFMSHFGLSRKLQNFQRQHSP
jgi:hypothetical protein